MPTGVLVCGPSGVGKSSQMETFLRNARAPKSFVLVDPDRLEAVDHKEASEKAIAKVHELIEERKSFVQVGTCGGTRYVNSFLKEMKAKKFHTVIAIVYTSLPTALERIAKRSDQPVPEEVVRDLHAFFKTKAERFMNLSGVDDLYLYNNETELNLLLQKKKKQVVCSKPEGDFYFDVSKYC